MICTFNILNIVSNNKWVHSLLTLYLIKHVKNTSTIYTVDKKTNEKYFHNLTTSNIDLSDIKQIIHVQCK